jgi:hypothetical protein
MAENQKHKKPSYLNVFKGMVKDLIGSIIVNCEKTKVVKVLKFVKNKKNRGELWKLILLK